MNCDHCHRERNLHDVPVTEDIKGSATIAKLCKGCMLAMQEASA